MAKPYAEEMTKLAETFVWATAADLQPLKQAIRIAGLWPLRAIGSGGSLTCAYALAGLHQRHTGHLCTAVTPMAATDEPLGPAVTNWLLSASGSNIDIMAAAEALILEEPRQLSVLCGREASPLAKLCRQHPFVDLLLYPPPAGKDGFLATNSLFGFITLLTRAYAIEFDSEADWREVVNCLEPLLSDSAITLEAWETATRPLWVRPTMLVLYGPSTQIGAVDLESKFTEAALGHLQLADYRNFAHGRHHWLAKHSKTSAVLAFITDADRPLAERTLDLVPADIPQARITFSGGPSAVALASLLAAIRITEWAGLARGIDPGRPGVPRFGRKLYHLPLPRRRQIVKSLRLTTREAAAIARKAGAAPSKLAAGELAQWHAALTGFVTRLRAARFAGVVLDYDGTIVDTRHRFESVAPKMAAELTRFTKAGIHVAVATGRGKSVRQDLRKCLPRALWPLVLVGYYNGAEVASLDDNGAPDGSANVCSTLRPLIDALGCQPKLAECARREDRRFQITLEATRVMPEGRLWELVHEAVLLTDADGVNVTRSSHSVDIVAPGVSKLNVVRRLRETIGDAPILAIGDRGRWPGNDYELLGEPFALGVDEINSDPETCWHLGEPGQRGPIVSLDYFSALEVEDGRLRFKAESLR